MIKANLRNQVRQTPLPKWKPWIPLFEAVINSFQAIRDARKPAGTGRILIEIEREKTLVAQDDAPITSFKVTDNGVGMDDDNFDSFNTSFSDWKMKEGGKGLGRFTWLKAFERVEIDTVFIPPESPTPQRRTFVFDESYDADKGKTVNAEGQSTGTTIVLVGFKEPYRSETAKATDQIIQRLVEHFLLLFFEPGCPQVTVIDLGLTSSVNSVFEKEYRTTASEHEFKVKGIPFTMHGFRLTTPRVSKHKLVYAANQRGVVSENLDKFVPNLNRRLPDEHGGSFVYLGFVQSPYLTDHVNPARTDFDLEVTEDDDAEQPTLAFEQGIRRADIRDECIKRIHEDLAKVIMSINEEKQERIREYVQTDAPQYKILLRHSDQFIDKITPNATKTDMEIALHRELYQRETRMTAEGSRIIKEAEKVDDYEGYFRRFSEFMANYNELGTAALTQYVMHRKIILEFLERAISLDPADGKYPLEKVVHQLVFPMRYTSEDIPNHEQNLWMIDERLTFHSFCASDKPLKALEERLEAGSAKRGDLVIFDEKIIFSEGEHPINSITTVEFKRPGRDDYTASDNPAMQSFKLIDDIRSGTFMMKGRPISVANDRIPATSYSICDLTPSLRQALKDMDAYVTPDNQGYYGFHRGYAVYYEIMDYNKLLRDAQKRNRVFFDKLNVLGNK
jgi:hypothetical protein